MRSLNDGKAYMPMTTGTETLLLPETNGSSRKCSVIAEHLAFEEVWGAAAQFPPDHVHSRRAEPPILRRPAPWLPSGAGRSFRSR